MRPDDQMVLSIRVLACINTRVWNLKKVGSYISVSCI